MFCGSYSSVYVIILGGFATESVCVTRGAGVALGLLTIMETIGLTRPYISGDIS